MNLLGHNSQAVASIEAEVRMGYKKILYVAGTGCGKTWVFMGTAEMLAHTINGGSDDGSHIKVLYVMPKHVIKNNVEGYEEYRQMRCKTDFVTFNYFNDYQKGMDKISQYDLIVVDECHHLGSDLYGAVLLSCMNDSDKFFLGLTATPTRDTDGVNVGTFFDATVTGITVFDAIRRDLMPVFNYHLCLPEKDTKQLESEYDNEIHAVVDYKDSEKTVKSVVHMYNRKKWICFFNTQQECYDAIPMINKIFKGYKVLVLLSSLKNLSEVMETVRAEEKVVILSVNILLEGVHLDGITGIILYRNVTSTIAFQQMLGRVCRIGNTVSPVVIDTSASARKILAKLLRENGYSDEFGDPRDRTATYKEIMRIGIGCDIEYDINKVLRICDKQFAITEDNKKAAQEAVSKYLRLRGRTHYKSLEELMKNNLDFKKLQACSSCCDADISITFSMLSAVKEAS